MEWVPGRRRERMSLSTRIRGGASERELPHPPYPLRAGPVMGVTRLGTRYIMIYAMRNSLNWLATPHEINFRMIAWHTQAPLPSSGRGRSRRSRSTRFTPPFVTWFSGKEEEGRYKATWKREFKLPLREAGPPNHQLNISISNSEQ